MEPIDERNAEISALKAALESFSKMAKELKKERDDAREKIERQSERIRYLEGATNYATGTPLSVALRERDEARETIVGWENKWKCAIEMAAQAEADRDNAQDQLDVAMKAIKRLEDQINELKS